MSSTMHDKCIACNSKRVSMMLHYKRVPLMKCSDCCLVFAAHIPTEKQLADYYEHYGQGHYLSPLTVVRYNQWLNKFEEYRSTSNILDIGCARGYFLDEAKKRGWNVYGTEYSERLVSACRAKGIITRQGGLHPGIFSGVKFDVILSIEVIEHINNPNYEFEIIRNLLRPGGLFYCTTPNFNSLERLWLGEKFNVISWPEHLTYYTSRTLKRTAARHGFAPLKITTTGLSITRIRQSRGKTKQAVVSAKSDDEVLRNVAERNFLLGKVKTMMNYLLNLSRTGMSLKGWFILKNQEPV